MTGGGLFSEYGRHLAAKEARVRGMLAAHGLEDLFAGIRRCPVEGGFRGHASFRLSREGGAARVLGVEPRGGRLPLEDTLWVLPEEARPTVLRVRDVVLGGGWAEAVFGFELRLEHGTLRAHVAVSSPNEAGVPLEPLCRALVEVPGVLGAAVVSQGVEAGEAWLANRLGGMTILAHHRAFFQSNLRLVPEMVEEIQRPLERPASIVDLYCGAGLHSVLAAAPGTRVAGADNNPWAIESARRNAALHGLSGAEYARESAEEFAAAREFDAPDVVFVNPSRLGCGPGVPEAVARWRPAGVCLVSCSIDAHLRDVLAFQRAGYRPAGVRCFDMFPFSEYLESVTHFAPE
ncbi:MAG TPA: methyltransferase domain-containing protein [Longimicrobiaceae bacterium]|nr:methyltransferase domain-containing protein [Longimicrobiaceae bacterium]